MTTRYRSILATIFLAVLLSCQPEPTTSPPETQSMDARDEKAASINTVDVIAKDFSFHVADEILSGWTTFRLKNEGHATHFFLLNQLPEGITFEQYRETVPPIFDRVWDALKTGAANKAEAGAMLGELLPEWYFAVRQMGGSGFIAPGQTALTTMKLEPGRYAMECYIKTVEGIFHSTLGMIRQVTVLTKSSDMVPPDADVEMNLSNFEIQINGELMAGKNTVAVHFNEHPEFGLGNDVHLALLEDDTDFQDVLEWMDWMNPGGLRSPAPARFMGGTQEMPVGNTAYFTVNLEPGQYAWIAESAAEKGMFVRFTIEGH